MASKNNGGFQNTQNKNDALAKKRFGKKTVQASTKGRVQPLQKTREGVTVYHLKKSRLE